MATGQISLLVSRDLQALVQTAEGLEPAVAKQLRQHTRREAEPVFQDEVAGRARTRVQQAVLVRPARVAVSNTNVTLKTAHAGKVGRDGTIPDELKGAAEFGANPNKRVTQRSRKGKAYTRRLGNAFGPNRRDGIVFFPSVYDSVPRMGALWHQTAVRTVAEEFEKVGA